MTTYINIFGGPGSGKSTTAALIFGSLKIKGFSVELVTEVAKDFVWEDRIKTLDIQPYVLMKQFRNLYRLNGKVDYVVTDSPILMGCVYADLLAPDLPKSYKQLLIDLHKNELGKSDNYLLKRVHKYDTNGRYQKEDAAKQIDVSIQDYLDATSTRYNHIEPSEVLKIFE